MCVEKKTELNLAHYGRMYIFVVHTCENYDEDVMKKGQLACQFFPREREREAAREQEKTPVHGFIFFVHCVCARDVVTSCRRRISLARVPFRRW